jgi:ABC-2 type transport system permease protein
MLVTPMGVVFLTMVTWLGVYTGIHTTMVKESRMARYNVPVLRFTIPNPLGEREQFRTPLSEKTHIKYFTTACINLGALGLCIAGIATALSAMDRYRWRTLGMVIGFIVAQMMLRLLSAGAESFSWVGWFSIFTLYQPESAVMVSQNAPIDTWSFLIHNPMRATSQWGPMAASGWLLAFALAGFLFATAKFIRRDLPAPL